MEKKYMFAKTAKKDNEFTNDNENDIDNIDDRDSRRFQKYIENPYVVSKTSKYLSLILIVHPLKFHLLSFLVIY